jgi:hypothetical protein
MDLAQPDDFFAIDCKVSINTEKIIGIIEKVKTFLKQKSHLAMAC